MPGETTHTMNEQGTEEISLRTGTKKKGWLRRKLSVTAFIPESLVLLGLMAVLNLAFWPGRPGFLGVEPNPFWVVVLLMAGRYGFKGGLFSALVTGATYMGLVATRVGDDVITARDLMNWQYAGPAVLFIATGVLLGMIIQRKHNRLARVEQDNEELVKENLELKRGEEELRDVNVELANRVVGATDTLPMLYKYAKKLNNLDVAEVLTTLTELVVEVTKARQASVYWVHGNQLPLHARNGKVWDNGPELVLEPGLYEILVVRRQVLTLHDLTSRGIKRKDLYLCGPLSEGTQGEISALLAVEDLDFLRYNPATIRLFNVIVDWACASLEKASQFRDRPEALHFEEARTSILRAQQVQHGDGVISATMAQDVSGFTESASHQMGIDEVATTVAAPPEGMAADDLVSTVMDLSGPAIPAGQFDDRETTMLQHDGPASTVRGMGKAPPLPYPAQRLDPAAGQLHHMLTGELQIADNHGLPLGRLLTEITDYVEASKGRTGR